MLSEVIILELWNIEMRFGNFAIAHMMLNAPNSNLQSRLGVQTIECEGFRLNLINMRLLYLKMQNLLFKQLFPKIEPQMWRSNLIFHAKHCFQKSNLLFA